MTAVGLKLPHTAVVLEGFVCLQSHLNCDGWVLFSQFHQPNEIKSTTWSRNLCGWLGFSAALLSKHEFSVACCLAGKSKKLHLAALTTIIVPDMTGRK